MAAPLYDHDIVIESAEKPDVKQWNFDVKRDAKGRMTQVVATAITNRTLN